jgi:3-deoxy-D-manno-octulosonic-acid transferase
MLLLYNILLLLAVILFSPFWVAVIFLSPKYRGRVLRRLGVGLDDLLRHGSLAGPRIWIHALSVGEVASSRSLVAALRSAFPDASILFSSATRTGEETAVRTLAGAVDLFVPFPFDFSWNVRHFFRGIAPDLFILVETDFWPNFLHDLRDHGAPGILVNGRVSKQSHARYRRLKPFFLPLFQSFRFLAMQNESDVLRMRDLGVPPEKILKLGNLKYGSMQAEAGGQGTGLGTTGLDVPAGKVVWSAGSTHEGEEGMVLAVHKRLLQVFPELFLVVAPRHPQRGEKVAALAGKMGLSSYCRTGKAVQEASVMVLDTIGELLGAYAMSEIVFVGGSLVHRGGHNPLEPAFFGKPVLFGPHMDDFEEIGKDFLQSGGGEMVRNEEELFLCMRSLLEDPSHKEEKGRKAADLVKRHQGVTDRYVALVREVLKG